MPKELTTKVKKIKEEVIAQRFVEKLKPYFNNEKFNNEIIIKTQADLQYANIFSSIDDKGIGKNPITKTFRTDILILQGNTPRVVVEVKQESYTTHDIITYSEKAKSHKRLFPHLRYGFLCLESKSDKLAGRYYQNAYGFDFENCITKENEDNYLLEYVEIINKQIQRSQFLEERIFNKKTF